MQLSPLFYAGPKQRAFFGDFKLIYTACWTGRQWQNTRVWTEIAQKGPSQFTKFYEPPDKFCKEEAECAKASVAHNPFNEISPC